MKHPAKLSHEFSGTLRTFSFWMANGSVGLPLLEGIDYWDGLKESPSLMEEVYAIYANVLEFDESGERRSLHSPRPREWSYCRWFQQILASAREQGVSLYFVANTEWINVEPSVRADLLRAYE